MATIPDELTILSGFIQMPEVFSYPPVVSSEAGEQVITPACLTTTLVDQVHHVSRIYSSVGCECTEGVTTIKTQSIKGFSLKSLTH